MFSNRKFSSLQYSLAINSDAAARVDVHGTFVRRRRIAHVPMIMRTTKPMIEAIVITEIDSGLFSMNDLAAIAPVGAGEDSEALTTMVDV